MKKENLSREPQCEMRKVVEKKEIIEMERDDQRNTDNSHREVRKVYYF